MFSYFPSVLMQTSSIDFVTYLDSYYFFSLISGGKEYFIKLINYIHVYHTTYRILYIQYRAVNFCTCIRQWQYRNLTFPQPDCIHPIQLNSVRNLKYVELYLLGLKNIFLSSLYILWNCDDWKMRHCMQYSFSAEKAHSLERPQTK